MAKEQRRCGLGLHTDADVTAQLNQVYGVEASRPDPVLARLQESSIPREEW
jgi:hypothetical protein